MTLIQDPKELCLWVPVNAVATGTHILIIGISDYPHLGGGRFPPQQRASVNGGLGQLEVSALTGAKVFECLSKMGAVAGAAIASCRVLLSPRDGERKLVDQLTAGHYGSADFESIRRAVEAWSKDIFNAGRRDGDNVALFFFSGHGVEHHASPALLASDILDPSAPNGANRAIAHDSLLRAIKTFGIDRGLFLVDACRDAPEVVKRLNIVGRDLLEPYTDPNKSPDALISLQSTGALFKSYQVPGAPATLFGLALLEALDGPPPSHQPYDTTSLPWRLRFGRLESHVKQRVRELLRERTANKLQPVEPHGLPYNCEMLVAEKPGFEKGTGEPSAPSVAGDLRSLPSIKTLVASRSEDLLKGFTTTSAKAVKGLREQAHANPNFSGDLSDFAIMQEIFGSESITEPWIKSLQILDAETGTPVASETVFLLAARREQVGDSLTAWLDVGIAPSAGGVVWIHAGAGGDEEPSFAVAIPRDQYSFLPVRLDVAFRHDANLGWAIEAMSARLAEPTRKFGAHWHGLWEIQRIEALSDLGSAGMACRKYRLLENTLSDKVRSPLAAAIATTVLLRCNALDYLHDFPRNLAEWFPWQPDGAILWAETLLRRQDVTGIGHRLNRVHSDQPKDESSKSVTTLAMTPQYHEARAYFAKLADRGSPLLRASLSFAALQVPFWRRVLNSQILDAHDYHELLDACELVERTTKHLASGGLFAGFVSTTSNLRPTEVLGRRQPVQKKRLRAA